MLRQAQHEGKTLGLILSLSKDEANKPITITTRGRASRRASRRTTTSILQPDFLVAALGEMPHTCQSEVCPMQRFYPAVLERGPKQAYGVWFPDFPRCVAGGVSQEDAMARAQDALARAVESLAEQERRLPEPTPFEKIAVPKDCDLVTFFAVGVEPPDPSERVNIYLSKSLIARADRRAAELGMSRSSFFGYAVSSMLALENLGHLAPIAARARLVQTWSTRARGARKSPG
jgi:predicted RNase H-like HicB family nuclease